MELFLKLELYLDACTGNLLRGLGDLDGVPNCRIISPKLLWTIVGDRCFSLTWGK